MLTHSARRKVPERDLCVELLNATGGPPYSYEQSALAGTAIFSLIFALLVATEWFEKLRKSK
jgi:hypothetical protein